MLDVQPGVSEEERIKRLPLVSPGVVQQGDDGSAKVAQEVTEKHTDFQVPDVVEKEVAVESQALASSADGDSGDDGHLVAAVAMAVHGRLPSRCPSLEEVRDQEESGFVNEDEVGAQPCGVFFTRGQVFRFQRSMAASSRSTARRSGF